MQRMEPAVVDESVVPVADEEMFSDASEATNLNN